MSLAKKVVREWLTLKKHCHFVSFMGQVTHCKTSSGAETGHTFRVLAGCQFIKLLVSCTDPLQTIYYSCCCLCLWVGRQHVNASYNWWWMAPACQSLTHWVFSNFIICPFLYSLQPSTYDKVAFILNDIGWARIPKNHSAFRRVKFFERKHFLFPLLHLEWSRKVGQEYLLLQK